MRGSHPRYRIARGDADDRESPRNEPRRGAARIARATGGSDPRRERARARFL